MNYKSFRDKLRRKYGCHKSYDLNDDIRQDMKLVKDWCGHEPIIVDNKLSFIIPHKMMKRYPITYSSFIQHIDPSLIDCVNVLYTSPDEFFKNLHVQSDQTRLDGTVIKTGSSFESDLRYWVCLDYKGHLDKDRLCCPWYYDINSNMWMLMLHNSNSGLSHIRRMK